MSKATPAERRWHIYAEAASSDTFYANVRSRVLATEDDCWEWQGSRTIAGYGQAWYRPHQTTLLVHRVMCIREHGEFDPKFHVDHLCRNPSCVNAAHVEAVPARVNWERGVAPSALVYATGICKRGHSEWRELASGGRICRACHRAREERIAAKKPREPREPRQGLHGTYSRTSGKSGIRGVAWDSRKERWRVNIWHDGANRFVGYFYDIDEAAQAADAKRLELGGKPAR